MSKSALPQTPARRSLNELSNWRLTVFTVVEARRALPYVARVTHDAASAFKTVNICRSALAIEDDASRRVLIGQRRDAALSRLNAAIDECNDIGVDLVDLAEGVVRFNSSIDGRMANLMWRLGDSVTDAWSPSPEA